jgi:thiosulfate dehydrogenase
MLEQLSEIIQYLVRLVWMALVLLLLTTSILFVGSIKWPLHKQEVSSEVKTSLTKSTSGSSLWHAPDSLSVPNTPDGEMIKYGHELVAHTSVYLGPKGKVKSISNGMNCQNCHLKAGTRPFGNNYGAVASTYPKFRARSGTVESIEKRVNDCLQRSLNGQALDTESYEMRSFVSYIKWVGKDVHKDQTLTGFGLLDLPILDRAADPEKGKLVYITHCQKCHGKKGNGVRSENELEWKYPPLWGEHSFNIGAGLYRLSRLAGYVKANMPNGTTFENPILSDEQAWDVAAYVNSLPRPKKDISKDWPDISTKPFDHPFGPYVDKFSEQDHKYGPYAKIKSSEKKK